MSNSEPSAILLHGIACMYGLYKFSWIIQVSAQRTCAAYLSTNEVRSAAAAHGQHEKRIGGADPNWPDWYAEYMVREQAGKELPQ